MSENFSIKKSMPDSQKVAIGENAIDSGSMFAEGYMFGGWYIDSECTTPYNFETPVTEDIILYAKWLPSAYKFVNTGDGFNALLWPAMLGLSLSVMAFILIQNSRKEYLAKKNDF